MSRKTIEIMIYTLAVMLVTLFLAYQPEAEASERDGLLGIGDTRLYTGAWSTHLYSGDYDYREEHNLLAVDHRSYMAGYFKNSFGDDTFMVGKSWTKGNEYFEAGVTLGVNYGYRDCKKKHHLQSGDKEFCLMVWPSVFYVQHEVEVGFIFTGFFFAGTVRWEL